MRLASCVVAAIALAALACGPTSPGDGDGGMGGGDGGGGDDDAPDARIFADGRLPSEGSEVSGTVWAPGNAPGMVPAGHEIPIAGAAVYITDVDPPAIMDGAYCDPCQEAPSGAAITDAKGRFTLTGIQAGTWKLVIQKAQFRLVREVTVEDKTPLAVSAVDTTLPSTHDPANGEFIPRIALVVTNSDRLEDVLAKMGFVDLASSGQADGARIDRNDHFDLYGSYAELPPFDSPPYPTKRKGTIEQLLGDLNRMKRYHIILIPCAYNEQVNGVNSATIRDNIRQYVADGGKLFVTDWSAEWEDAVFPDFIKFATGLDTDAAMVAAGTINPANGDYGHFAEHASAEEPGLRDWLDGQRGPIVEATGGEWNDYHGTYTQGTIDASNFVIEGIWTLIESLGKVRTGTDDMGQPIEEQATVWVSGDYTGARSPHTVTFEPSCGRVMYSTYHTANEVHVGLVPQERVLLYLLMEIGVCFDIPEVDE
jgi:hypothetical protein